MNQFFVYPFIMVFLIFTTVCVDIGKGDDDIGKGDDYAPTKKIKNVESVRRQSMYNTGGYGCGYAYRTPRVEAQLYTSKDHWSEKRRQFEAESNARKKAKADKNRKQFKDTSSTSSKSDKPRVNYMKQYSGPIKIPDAVIKSSMLVGDGSYGRANIAKILIDQLGVAYSRDGEVPEDGFSPVGLIKYVARKLGVEPKSNNAAEAWENAGLFIKVPYGQFETGDLLFYKLFSKSAQKDELFLALALDDEFMVYPSFSRKKVIKRSFKDSFWEKHFIGAKRIPPQMR